MRTGIQYQSELDLQQIRKNGFDFIEAPYEELVVAGEQLWKKICIDGILLRQGTFTAEMLGRAIDIAGKCNAQYLVIETVSERETDGLKDMISLNSDLIKKAELEIYIENGFYQEENGRYEYTAFSEMKELLQICEWVNECCGRKCCGICMNVGYANLLGKNMRSMIEEAGPWLKLLHANDNDGRHNVHQMPYSFTTGRGAGSTDWFRVIGSLVRVGFSGRIVFDVTGIFRRTPEGLHDTMLKLLFGIKEEWEYQFTLEERLHQPDKELILFGAGKMVQDYLAEWGKKYPPSFLVDNNRDIWGEERLGFVVKSPAAITDIPEEKRNVWICNMYYDAIGEQLERMGVSYSCYWDHYYL